MARIVSPIPTIQYVKLAKEGREKNTTKIAGSASDRRRDVVGSLSSLNDDRTIRIIRVKNGRLEKEKEL
jgi:hypothetical protein